MSQQYLRKNEGLIYILCMLYCLYSTPLFAQVRVVGWVEKVSLTDAHFPIMAKLDTGADSSSLNAIDAKIVDQGEDKYIIFKMVNDRGNEITLERKIVRWAKIKNKFNVKKKRPVIMMKVCIANISRVVEVNLVDRSNYQYQMLIGRSYLIGRPNLLVDSSRQFTQEANCHQ